MVTTIGSNDLDAGGHRRQRRRRRRLDSCRYAAPIIALAAVVPSCSAEAAGPCDDNPTYVSPIGLTCSQHASLDANCEAFGLMGMQEELVGELLQNCPRSCKSRTSGGGDNGCDDETSDTTNSDGAEFPALIFPRSAGTENLALNRKSLNGNRVQNTAKEACHVGWDRSCQDDPLYRSKYGLTCANHQKLDCEAFVGVGFTEYEAFQLVVSCPCSCGIPCGIYTEAPSASPSSVPTDDFYRCTEPTCQDDPTYRSKLSLKCENHARFDCTTMDAIGYSDGDINELINRCPCSCRTMCGDYTMSPSAAPSVSPTISHQPTGRPTISSMPSSLPSARPSTAPSHAPTTVPSLSPSEVPTQSLSPSSIPSMDPSISLEPSLAPTVAFSAAPSSDPTRFPTLSPNASPSASPSDVPSTFPTASPSST